MVVLSGKGEPYFNNLPDQFRFLTEPAYLDSAWASEVLFAICEECEKMPAIPQGAFATYKVRAQKEKDLTVSTIKITDKPEPKIDNKKLLEYTPVKYNSKLMKSIWGLYNRYSPHNMKGNDDDGCYEEVKLQQPVAVAAFAIAENLAMAFSSGNEWTFPGKPEC